ncbi:MAG: hypothetical protein DA408_11945 [Bacteroidetes bacterium]|nr:MAG: hypothetical protein C7N36_16955 [Bacteroidota bacterium]PTM12074.1 MAG: hypothetical protein DA408_11945 [Bacteroidota bacterium]
MPQLLQNQQLEIHLDLPDEGYHLPRFDWTGKITLVKFQNTRVSGTEKPAADDDVRRCGRGLYNEFGIEAPVGYADTPASGWFSKLGVGWLKRDDQPYHFAHDYEIRPAVFNVQAEPNKIHLTCTSPLVNGYAYVLKKEIELLDSSFVIRYLLQNTGTKAIVTDEYNHNFLAIGEALIGKDYSLKFPFELQPALFGETVNPAQKVELLAREVRFNGVPADPFFFSNLSGGESVPASWELIHRETGIGIRETGSFTTRKINLWGWQHVVSPELFFRISLPPGQSVAWSRRYDFYRVA